MATRGRRRRGPSQRGAVGHPEPARPGRYTALPADTHSARRGGPGGPAAGMRQRAKPLTMSSIYDSDTGALVPMGGIGVQTGGCVHNMP